MDNQFFRPGDLPGFQYEARENGRNRRTSSGEPARNKPKRSDEDLIIEDNTVYEIDRNCIEKLRKRKSGRNRNMDYKKSNS